MKYILLLAAWIMPGLASAGEALPQIVKNFGEQQGIAMIKEIDSPGGGKRVDRPVSGYGGDPVFDAGRKARDFWISV